MTTQMGLALSKTLDPADFVELAEELTVVDKYFASAREQHPMRRWEYAMALKAIGVWMDQQMYVKVPRLADVGGAGSPFKHMFSANTVTVIDPDEGGSCSLDDYVSHAFDDVGRTFEIVTCLSVLEHVDDLDQFLYYLSCLVAPGGLLFLTLDYCDDHEHEWPPDRYHFNWMRKRIFGPYALGRFVAAPLLSRDFSHLGEANFLDYQATVYDYSFASLALVKRA